MNKDPDLKPFRKWGEYEWPKIPATHTARSLLDRFTDLLDQNSDEPLIGDDRLHLASREIRDHVLPPPACGPLMAELEVMLDEWINEKHPDSNTRLIVLPPCQHPSILTQWAEQHAHQLLQAPPRTDTANRSRADIHKLEGDGLLVIPELAHWYLRHRNGFSTMRSLLAELASSQRRCLIGCNSWAWAFLRSALNAQLALRSAWTFEAFNDERLKHWITELTEESDTVETQFLESDTGENILETDEEECHSNYLKTLAGHSLGIPWVAWATWRHNLRTIPPDEKLSDKVQSHTRADADTYWLTAITKYELPDDHYHSALLMLHALLIHDSLTRDELMAVLPHTCEPLLVNALIERDIVVEQQGQLRCTDIAYPDMRQNLSDAGFPLDSL